MASRLKEDEKNERIIRSLLKLPENRRCINCNSLGPQYVCTNFWTFVCTTCSGIHREFTHRVKSVSMAKFTSQEVSALQGGGNASAKEIYFKEWDPQRNSLPDSSNVERLRDFIKHIYVDRRYTGERSFEKPPRVKMGETEDLSEKKKMDSYQGGSRSPPYDDAYERRYSDRPSPGGRSDDRNYRNSYDERRSPGYDSDYRKSPARIEVVNDWRREDRFGNGKKPEDTRISDGGSKLDGKSPDRQSNVDISSPPMVRPVRDILGENVSPLRVIEPPPKANGARSADGLLRTQRTASSSSLTSSNGNPAETKVESSLIDFDAVPEPVTATVAQTQQTSTGLPMAHQTATPNDNWANFDSVPEVKISQAPSNANLVESLVSELSVPTPFPGPSSSLTAPTGNMTMLPPSKSFVPASPFASSGPAAAPVSNATSYPPSGFLFPAAGTQPPTQPFMSAVGGASGNQPWNTLVAPNTQLPTSVPAPTHSGGVTKPSTVEVIPTGKRELPEDLFTANYSSFPAPMPGWHTAPPHYGYGFNMPYNTAVPVPTFSQSQKSSNPFDFNSGPSPVPASTFPSMLPLQGALPNVTAPTGLQHTPTPTWMPPQSSHPMAMASHAPTYVAAVPPSSFMGQQNVPSNMPPPRQQGAMGFGMEQAGFGSFIQNNQQPSGLYSSPVGPPNSFSSVGGNPFG